MKSRNEWLFLPKEVDPYGVVAIGGPLNTDRLLRAYTQGVFPWPQDEQLVWFSPQLRGVLYFAEYNPNSRFLRAVRNSGLEFRENQNFEKVIRGCSTAKRKSSVGTWLTEEMIKVYCEFHRQGYAQSFEAYRDGELVGGLYGVFVDGAFSAESVYGAESNVAKFCLHECVQTLKKRGLTWMDIQMVTPLTEMFGGKYIDRNAFLKLLPRS